MRRIPARDRYVPQFGVTRPFEDDYGCWTCCLCGMPVVPDEGYTFCGDEVCHEECLEKENKNGSEEAC